MAGRWVVWAAGGGGVIFALCVLSSTFSHVTAVDNTTLSAEPSKPCIEVFGLDVQNQEVTGAVYNNCKKTLDGRVELQVTDKFGSSIYASPVIFLNNVGYDQNVPIHEHFSAYDREAFARVAKVVVY